MPSSPDVLGLFAKWPQPGAVKTRLAAATSPEFAARVADAFLRDSLGRLVQIAARRVVGFVPADQESAFAAVVSPAWELTAQSGSDLGARLTQFFSDMFARGVRRVVIVGADSPTLPLPYVRDAFEQLTTHEVVIGPAADGGYYLVGLSRPAPELFAGIAWGSSTVLAQTVARLGRASFALLPSWYDVDTLDDWQMLQGHLAALRHAGHDALVPHTEALCT